MKCTSAPVYYCKNGANWVCKFIFELVLVLIGTDSYLIVFVCKLYQNWSQWKANNSFVLLLPLMMVNIFVHTKGSNKQKRLHCKTYNWLFSRHMFVCSWVQLEVHGARESQRDFEILFFSKMALNSIAFTENGKQKKESRIKIRIESSS